MGHRDIVRRGLGTLQGRGRGIQEARARGVRARLGRILALRAAARTTFMDWSAHMYRINTQDSRFAYSRTLRKGAPDLHKNTAIHARAEPK